MPERGGSIPRRGRWAALAVCGALGLGVALWAASDASSPPPPDPTATKADAGNRLGGFPREALPTGVTALEIAVPDPGHPVAEPDAAFCDEGNWSRVAAPESRNDAGELAVDRELWESQLIQTQVGLASWMSRCLRDGEPVTIVARDGGAVLATYDPGTGFRSGP